MDHPALHRQLLKLERRFCAAAIKRSTWENEVTAETNLIALLEKEDSGQRSR